MRTFNLVSFVRPLLKGEGISVCGNYRFIPIALIVLLFEILMFNSPVSGQEVLFDFDNAPLSTSLPIDLTAGGITAHFSATGQGYSIQNANVLGFTPPGFSGRIIYPNSINLSDLRIGFDRIITHFNIMYSCQELGCDDAATMRVTAYMNGSLTGTRTHTAGVPGTWPVDTLSCTFPQGFDSVVVHYDMHPPTCQDYGTIFMADNMRVTPIVTSISESGLSETFALKQNYPNPFNSSSKFKFEIAKFGNVKIVIYDIAGKEIRTLVNESLKPGMYETTFDGSQLSSGVYFYKLITNDFIDTKKMILLK
ncbi:MAG: T9SS type A sorting domain-containing protein [Ignavibacteria bacterium]|nr:T9SS type A sorting domain-containing protein [Ignavibacteria bacterium]